MKKILQINIVVNYGSTGIIAEEIGRHAIEEGWESYIAFGRKERPSKSKLIKIGSDLDINLHVLQTRLFDRHGFGSHRATQKLINQIEKINPDIIHLHNLHGYYINIKILFDFLSKADIPIVWTLHDCWPITGHCVHFDSINCERWKTHCFNCPLKNSYPASFLIDRSSKNHLFKKNKFTSIKRLTIVPVSNWLGNIIKKSFLNCYPIQVINNGVDCNIFVQNKTQKIREKYNVIDKLIILGVSNTWEPRKRLSDFIELSKSLDNSSVIILVGLSSTQLKNLPKNIIGIPRTESVQELVDLYSAADIYLNLSIEETFGKTTAEALACGTPIIVYNATACPELVSPETGFIVEKGNIISLLESINIVRRAGREHFAFACRERALKLYNKNDRISDYINLYKSMMNK
ncbi:MAG: glycosyltransferase [Bacteroidetes bacterium]|nr:glycosyltransferase [Bacteroidota bacterium]